MSVYKVCILEMKGPSAMNSREIIRRLQKDGWFEVGQSGVPGDRSSVAGVESGSHKQFKHPVKPVRVTVVYPQKDVPEGTLRSIEEQSGLKLR